MTFKVYLECVTSGISYNSATGRAKLEEKKQNKRALWPWVAHLRMNVYKSIGKHRSYQSPAMNFDRSAVSLILVMLHFIRVCTVSYDKCNIQRLKFIFIRKVSL